jgi:hypothetical protein
MHSNVVTLILILAYQSLPYFKPIRDSERILVSADAAAVEKFKWVVDFG